MCQRPNVENYICISYLSKFDSYCIFHNGPLEAARFDYFPKKNNLKYFSVYVHIFIILMTNKSLSKLKPTIIKQITPNQTNDGLRWV